MNRSKDLGVTDNGSRGKAVVGYASILLLVIGLWLPAGAAADTEKDKLAYMKFAVSHPNLPTATSFLITQLEKYGYRYNGKKGSMASFEAKQTVVLLKLDDKSVVNAGLVSYGPQAELKKYSVALYLVYATLELNKSKSGQTDSKEIASRVSQLTPKLIEKAELALQGSARSTFRFEDMDVDARRGTKKKGFISIFLQPH